MAMAHRRCSRCTASRLGAVLVAVLAVSCGGDDDEAQRVRSDGDPVELVQQSVAPNPAARSGRIDGRVVIALKGVAAFAEPFTLSIAGPFQYRHGASLPDYELEMGVRDNGVGLTALRGRSWVSLGSTGFRMPGEIRRRLVRHSVRGENGLTRTLEQFGIRPWRWETDRRIAGTTRIDGVEVVHITTSFTAGRILQDANTLLGLLSSLELTATGLPDLISRPARRIVVRSVTLKKGRQWIGVRDKVMRRSGFTMKFAVARADRAKLGGISGGTVVGELHVTDVGRPQRISAPATIGSFSDFRAGVDAVGDARGR
jgi:hypothetical protein